MNAPYSVTRQELIKLLRVASFVLIVVTALAAKVSAARGPDTINVSDVEGLYAAVNDPDNSGATIVLAAGQYVLTARDQSGALRPNGGRLELQSGMSLLGVKGDPEAVVIDGSSDQGPSYVAPQGRTGMIRIGRSHESVEWLTVHGAFLLGACIATDLLEDSFVSLRIAHTILEGSTLGLDVGNIGTASAGRTITIDLDDNELSHNGRGVRFINSHGADGAAIFASLHKTRSHDNAIGCMATNEESSRASIDIDSHEDSFAKNRVGCILFGGTALTPIATANDNTLTFAANAGEIAFNRGSVPPEGDLGGLVVVGGLSFYPGGASRNVVHVSIWGLKFDDNLRDISAWGARTPVGPPAGTNNSVAIDLHGISKWVNTMVIPSVPYEAAGTNSAVIIQ